MRTVQFHQRNTDNRLSEGRVNRCTNCHEPKRQLRHGLCNACRLFLRRTGRHRTEADRIRARGQRPQWCANCGIHRASGRGELCIACSTYRQRHGANRPRHLWMDRCKVCGRPKDGTVRFAKGRCPLCYEYRRKFKRERPATVIQERYPLGWCDCGQPATQMVLVGVSLANVNRLNNDKVPMCDSCTAIENEVRSVTI